MSLGFGSFDNVNLLRDFILERLGDDVAFLDRLVDDPESVLTNLELPNGGLVENLLLAKPKPKRSTADCRLTCSYSCSVSCKTTRAFPPTRPIKQGR